MAASITTGFQFPQQTGIAAGVRSRSRRMTPEAGHALEILGHAIEYLTDEFVNNGPEVHARNPQLEAVQLLMSLNRQVYYECPFVPTLGERLRDLLHLTGL
jgi:hypothetical protein